MKKKISILVLVFLAISVNVWAQSAMTGTHCTFCETRTWMEDMISFGFAGDKISYNAYIQSDKCLIIKNRIRVTVIKMPMFSDVAQVAFKGIKVWVNKHQLSDWNYDLDK